MNKRLKKAAHHLDTAKEQVILCHRNGRLREMEAALRAIRAAEQEIKMVLEELSS